MSIVAATIKSKNQVFKLSNLFKIVNLFLFINIPQVIGLNDTSLLALKTVDSFLNTLNEKDIRLLLDLAKLASVYRLGSTAEYILINTFICNNIFINVLLSITIHFIKNISNFTAFIYSNKHIKLLLEYCVSEMETIYSQCASLVSPPSKHTVQESSHPYPDDSYLSGYVSIPGIY